VTGFPGSESVSARAPATLFGAMQLNELFTARDVIVDFDPGDKWEGIRVLVDHLVNAGRVEGSQVETILEAVLSRERSMSTGMEHGIAIPHAAVDGLESIVGCIGLVTRESGLSFESIDGQPARIVVLLVIPRQQKLLHIRTLADIARVLSREDVRESILAAETSEEAFAVLTRGEVESRS